MSLNPVEFQNEVEALRQEHPSPEAALLARRRLARPPTRSYRWIVVPAVLGIAGYLVWPRANSGVAWGQVLAQTRSATYTHRADYIDGKLVGERWENLPRRAITYSRQGKLVMEMRTDGLKVFSYYDFRSSLTGLVNARKFGTIARISQPSFESVGEDMLETLLKERNTNVKEHVDVGNGIERYKISIFYYVTPNRKKERPYVEVKQEVDVERASGRIVRIGTLDGKSETLIDYPQSIPDAVFEPRPHLSQPQETYDLEEQKLIVTATIRRGIASKSGITLRFVGIDGGGRLWVLWTGQLPSGKLDRPVRAVGLRAKPAAGIKAFTSNWASDVRKSFPAPAIRQRLGGMSLPLLDKAGTTLTLRVPGPKGGVTFANVPVMRFASIYNFGREFGLSR